MQCVKATFINFLLKPKQLFRLPQVFKLNRRPQRGQRNNLRDSKLYA